LGRYLEHPVRPRTADEIGALTSAFNAMSARLHHLIGTLEQQVRARTSQLETANKELESFSYSVSHDLRAPLRSLDGFSRALLEDYGSLLGDTGSDYLRRIRAASQHMGHLIDDLLSLASVSRVGLRRMPVDLTALAGAVADDLRQAEPTRDARFIIAAGLRATGDPRLLQVLLQNLLQNAWKFTSTRATARIECGQTMQDGTRAYFVRDNGVGFDMAYAHRLFGAFQRLHPSAEFPGTGIGLATVQRIVHRHGGRVWAESQLEQGATFYFTLADEGVSGT
jgi:light-regulated signal transduction histidine kinase (bacteriophytochrome)